MASLSSSSRLSVLNHSVVSLLNFGDHLKLVGMIHDEFLGLMTLVRDSCIGRNDLGLRCNCWNFVVILLYGGQVSGLSRNKMVLRLILTQDLGKLFGDVAY